MAHIPDRNRPPSDVEAAYLRELHRFEERFTQANGLLFAVFNQATPPSSFALAEITNPWLDVLAWAGAVSVPPRYRPQHDTFREGIENYCRIARAYRSAATAAAEGQPGEEKRWRETATLRIAKAVAQNVEIVARRRRQSAMVPRG